MKASDSFDLITRDEVDFDLYLILLLLWQAMSTADNAKAM